MLAALGREQGASCVVVGSIANLRTLDIRPSDVVVCGWTLPDGTGLEALAHVQSLRAALPVILVGPPEDPGHAGAFQAIRAGAFDVIASTDGGLRELPLAVEKCRARTQHLRRVVRELEVLSRTDELTGLANRRWLETVLTRAWDEAVRNDRPLAFLMIDVDGFKKVNDSLGHQRGDDVLRRTGRIIEANCRQVDVAGRYGGDEFCVLMPQCEARDATRVALRILGQYELAHGRRRGDGVCPGISIGVAHVNLSRPASAAELVAHADQALYAAKAFGKRIVMVRTGDGCCPPSLLGERQIPDYVGL